MNRISFIENVVMVEGYHPAEVGPNDRWKGKTWRDMPGAGETLRRLEFVLYRRGLSTGERREISEEHRAEIKRGMEREGYPNRRCMICGERGHDSRTCAFTY